MFSIVVPTFNSEQFIATTLEKVCGQITDRFEVEIIVVDDCSTDGTYELLLSLSEQEPKLKVVQLEQNGGPGYARNKGVEFAKYPWILFLDSDDAYSPHALETLYEHLIHNKDADIVCFDWEYDADSTSTVSGYEGRDDLSFIADSDKPDLIQAYLLNQIDPSVIYSVFRKDFLIENVLIFREGFHEDVDYMFIALLKAINISIFDKKLYLKNHRPESIVNTFSAKHIEGYFAALKAIAEQLKNHDEQTWWLHKSSFSQGLVNIVASRITRIFTFKVLECSAESLIFLLKEKVHALCHDFGMDVIHYQSEQKKDFKTKYQMIFDFFISQVDEVQRSGVEALQQYIESIRNKSWSCYDLHHSVFFAPDEIRTCCKRFFADGEMKGDVVLLDGASQHNEAGFSFDEIQTAKKQLHKEINRDNAPECSGCPFLHFEDWGQPLDQGIKYLSLEYHSVCNMKCTYCSDTYYGGEKAKYDVQETVDSLIDKGALDKAEYIVWGGGEPILDKAFEPILETISDAVASVKQRVITNATRYSEPLASLMKEDKAYIVTSIDAGTLEVFKEVRQYPRMGKVLENVKAYAKDAAHNVIIKYIFLPNNQSIEELKAFVTLMLENDLTNCNFQLSIDFTNEVVSPQTLEKIIFLYAALLAINVRFIFIDDLILQRLNDLSQEEKDQLEQSIVEQGIHEKVFANPASFNDVAVWGTGAQTSLLMEKSLFMKSVNVALFVDPRPERIGDVFFGKAIQDPKALLDSESPVIIAATQSAPHIYTQYLDMGLPENRLIRQIVL